MTRETILAGLGQHPWAGQLTVLDTVDSTNTYAKSQARQGAPHGTVVIADHQTGGKGRLGRSFSSPKGKGVYLSAVLRFDLPPTDWMHLTCVAAEAIRRAVLEASGLYAGIKWTNDLVYGRKKLCGILTELVTTPDGLAAIVGAGVNCTQQPEEFPPEVAAMATSLLQCGCPTDRNAVAAAMIRQLHLAAGDSFSQGLDGQLPDPLHHPGPGCADRPRQSDHAGPCGWYGRPGRTSGNPGKWEKGNRVLR